MKRNREFEALFEKAAAAGAEAGSKAIPPAMIVSEADVFGGPKPGGKSWYVAEGPCGFAGVRIRPGNSAFAKWMVREGKAHKDSYAGGVYWGISLYGQSYVRKEAFAFAAAKVLREAGIKAYSESRLD